MKTILSVPRVALLALALGTASVTATFAQSTTTTTAPTCTAGGHHHHGASVLTAAQKAQLKAAYTTALANNPSLQTEQASLKTSFAALKAEGKGNATPEQKQALRAQARTFHQDLKAAELSVDPTLTTVFAALKTAHHGHHSSS